MQIMNGKRQEEWRRNQVLELTSKGHTQTEISSILQISISTISRDLSVVTDAVEVDSAEFHYR